MLSSAVIVIETGQHICMEIMTAKMNICRVQSEIYEKSLLQQAVELDWGMEVYIGHGMKGSKINMMDTQQSSWL